MTEERSLEVYLNDHLTVATSGVELFRRADAGVDHAPAGRGANPAAGGPRLGRREGRTAEAERVPRPPLAARRRDRAGGAPAGDPGQARLLAGAAGGRDARRP